MLRGILTVERRKLRVIASTLGFSRRPGPGVDGATRMAGHYPRPRARLPDEVFPGGCVKNARDGSGDAIAKLGMGSSKSRHATRRDHEPNVDEIPNAQCVLIDEDSCGYRSVGLPARPTMR